MSSTLVGNPQSFGSAPATFDPATVEFTANIDSDPALETVLVRGEFNDDGSLKNYTLTDSNTLEPIYYITNGSLNVTGTNGVLKAVYRYPNSKQILAVESQKPVAPSTYSGGSSTTPTRREVEPRGESKGIPRTEPTYVPTIKLGENKGHHKN